MSNRDLKNLTEAYAQVFLKENGMEDFSKQDPREGFPSHEQDRYEDEESNNYGTQHTPTAIKKYVEDIINVLAPELKDDIDFEQAFEEISSRIIDAVNNIVIEYRNNDEDEETEDYDDEPQEMSDVDADADALAGAGYGTDEDYGGYGESLAGCYDQVMIEEAKKKINPWAVENALEKKTGKHFSKEKKEKIIKGIKKGAKKYGKNITSKAVKKK